ncbi:MAG TPA: hypothetical protein VGM18_07570 [Candidatus Sulfotelmatobacter sp.]
MNLNSKIAHVVIPHLLPRSRTLVVANASLMLSITAVLHTENDALRLGRALETLYACDNILIVDHDSRDTTVQLAREYGARVVGARGGALPQEYLRSLSHGWILCLDPRESMSEKLAASLFEWKSERCHAQTPGASAFSVFLREETPQGWLEIPAAQTRLVPLTWKLWNQNFPVRDPEALALEGELLRFTFP